MFTFLMLIFNVIFLFYVFDSRSYNIYRQDQIVSAEDFYNTIIWLLILNFLLISVKNFIINNKNIKEYFSKYINMDYFFFVFKVIIFIISAYYFIGIGNLFIRLFLIEHQMVILDGITNIGFNYKIEKVYSLNEKWTFASSIINENINFLNSTNNTNFKINITPEMKDIIANMKTLKEIKLYCIETTNFLFLEFKNSIVPVNNNNNNDYYIKIITYTAITVLVVTAGFLCYYYFFNNTGSTALLEATTQHVNTVTQDLKENKADIINFGARQYEYDNQLNQIQESSTHILNVNTDFNIKHIDNTIDILKLTKNNKNMIDKIQQVTTENKNSIDYMKQLFTEEKVKFLFNDKTYQLLKTLILWNDQYKGQFFDALAGSLELLAEKFDVNEEKQSFKNINDDKTTTVPFSGKGKSLQEKELN